MSPMEVYLSPVLCQVALSPMNPFLATRPLWRPVYLPTVVYAMGSSILAPAGVLLALQVGASSAAVVGMTTWIGAFAILASLLSGFVVGRWGENRSVGVISVLTALALVPWPRNSHRPHRCGWPRPGP